MNFTINELNAIATTIGDSIKADCGYDSVKYQYCIVRSGGEAEFTFYCTEDFQRNLDYKLKHQHGHLGFTLTDWQAELAALHNREERELRVLAVQTGETKAILAEMKSAAGRKFAKQIAATRDELANLLEAPK